MVNDLWAQRFNRNYVRHLVRTGSDHRPLLFKCHSDQRNFTRYFRFLNFWTTQDDFMDVVKDSWNVNILGNPRWRLQQKLKQLSRNLSTWSRDTIGDVHKKVLEWEKKVQLLEDQDLNKNTENSRMEFNKGQAEYLR